MTHIPKGWTFTLGLSVLAVLAATLASTVGATPEDDAYTAEGDPCFRYGRFECCIRPDE